MENDVLRIADVPIVEQPCHINFARAPPAFYTFSIADHNERTEIYALDGFGHANFEGSPPPSWSSFHLAPALQFQLLRDWVVIRCEPTDWAVIRSKELSLLGNVIVISANLDVKCHVLFITFCE